MELRPEDIQEILRIFSESELEELRLELGSTRLQVSKKGSLGNAAAPPVEASASSAPARPAGSPGSAAGAAPEAREAPVAAPPAAAASATPAIQPQDGVVDVRSPLLGVFYRRPAPNEPPFVEVGATVGPEDPVCIVDVMKMFTQVVAGTAGRIVEICVEDGVLVEHGQVLMRIAEA